MAIIGTIGQDIVTEAYQGGNYTYVETTNPATASGKVYSVKAMVQTGGTATNKLKLFRINGTDYDVIYDVTLTNLPNGENTITLDTPWNVLMGDLLAWWSGVSVVCTVGYKAGGSLKYIAATDVTTTTPIASFSDYGGTIDIVADILSVPSGGALNWFFSEAWQKHKKLWQPKLILPKDLGFQI